MSKRIVFDCELCDARDLPEAHQLWMYARLEVDTYTSKSTDHICRDVCADCFARAGKFFNFPANFTTEIEAASKDILANKRIARPGEKPQPDSPTTVVKRTHEPIFLEEFARS